MSGPVNLGALPCPYCWRLPEEPCPEDCPQYPIATNDDGLWEADPDVLADWSNHSEATTVDALRADRKKPDGVA